MTAILRKALFLIVCLTAMLCLVQCSQVRNVSVRSVEYVPAPPDYKDSAQWYISYRNADADIFYIISTEVGDYYLPNGQMCHFSDTRNDSIRPYLQGEMSGVDVLLSGELNYFSPYYRQCTMQTFTSDSLTAERMPLAMSDVRRAFRHYLDHLNGGRPFILAGFSQGAMHMLQLMKEMDQSVYERMIAAYCIGFVVTPADLLASQNIRPATGADDTGVTICYNSVRDAQTVNLFAGKGRSAFAINPVNWKTDETPATWQTEPTPWKPIAQQTKDTLTVHLDSVTNLLFVDGYSATDYMIPIIGKEGNYHSREIWLYREKLRQNIALRTERFQSNFKRGSNAPQ